MSIISNCVINLVPDKAQVFREAFRVLKPGGRLAMSDVVNIAPLPAELARRSGAAVRLHRRCGADRSSRRHCCARPGLSSRDRVKAGEPRAVACWAPGRGIEKRVASAMVEARKPLTSVRRMSSLYGDVARRRARAGDSGTFERYLTFWVALCIIAGIALGRCRRRLSILG